MTDKPSAAVRGKPNSSMAVGLALQAEGKSDAFVSAGNTGAQMAASMVLLQLHAGLKRPAIVTLFPDRAQARRRPRLRRQRGLLAPRSSCSSRGSAPSTPRTSSAATNPAVGLLSIGEEPEKGNAVVEGGAPAARSGRASTSSATSRDATFPPAARDRGPIDVVVCDGFVGNVVLKFYEAIAPLIIGMLAQGRRRRRAARWPRLKHLDYSEYGGAPLLGVKGVSIISHGKSSPRAIKNAIKVARAGRRDAHERAHRPRASPTARGGRRREAPVAYVAGTGRGIPAKVMTNHDFAALGLETIARVDRRAHRASSSGTSPRRTRRPARWPPTAARRRWSAPACTPASSTRSSSAPPPPIGCFLRPRSIFRRSSAPRAPRRSTSGAACSGWHLRHDRRRRADRDRASPRRCSSSASEKMSAIVDWKDRSTCVLFGDGAGAAVLKRAKQRQRASSRTFMRSDGTLADLLYRPARRRRACRSATTVLDDRSHFVKMAGREVFKHAVRSMADACDRALDAREAHGQRHRPADPAPGEHPHHRGDGEARQHPDGQGLRERRPLRQHLVRVDPDRARRGDRVRAHQGRDRRCCSSPSAPGSPGARWSFASERMPNVVLLFPGQGSQKPGMGKDLADALSRGARGLRRAPTRRSARPLSTLCFEGPADELTLTHNAQPALLAHGAAVWAVVRDAIGAQRRRRRRPLARRVHGVSRRRRARARRRGARSCAGAVS